MAIFYCNADIVSRSKGQNVIAKAAYEARARLKDENENKIKDYSKRKDLLFEGVFIPDNAPDWMKDRQKLWNNVVRKENESKRSATAQEARRFIIALPHENTPEQNIKLSKNIANIFIKYGMVADIALHKGATNENGIVNNHLHALTTLRDIDNTQALGFGNKNRKWNDRKFYHDTIEKEIAIEINKTLSPENRIEHTPYDETKRSYKGSVHNPNIMKARASNRRINKVIKELQQEEKLLLNELAKYAPKIEPVKQKPEVKPPTQSTQIVINNKDDLLVYYCDKQKDNIKKVLLEERSDMIVRQTNIKKGGFDEYYQRDQQHLFSIANNFNKAYGTKDINNWKPVYNALGESPLQFKYANNHYRLWEAIRQPYQKKEKELFPNIPTQTNTQEIKRSFK